MYDMLVLGHDGFDNGLRRILESERVQKVAGENCSLYFQITFILFIYSSFARGWYIGVITRKNVANRTTRLSKLQ